MSDVVRSVLTACRSVDGEAQLANYTVANGETRLRLRPGGENPEAISARLRSALPLARTGVHHNLLDGTMEAEVVVPSRGGEQVKARALVAEQPLARTLRLVTLLVIGAAVLLWARRAAAEPSSAHDVEEW